MDSVLLGFYSSIKYKHILPLIIPGYSGLFYSRRCYSTTRNPHSQFSGSDLKPKPILTLDLNNKACIKPYESILRGFAYKVRLGGIYYLVNTINGKQYIGSAKDFFIRLNEHLKYKNNSNAALQKVFVKYGLAKFNVYIYEYFTGVAGK